VLAEVPQVGNLQISSYIEKIGMITLQTMQGDNITCIKHMFYFWTLMCRMEANQTESVIKSCASSLIDIALTGLSKEDMDAEEKTVQAINDEEYTVAEAAEILITEISIIAKDTIWPELKKFFETNFHAADWRIQYVAMLALNAGL